MSPEFGFLGSLATTVALLAVVTVTGRKRLIRIHVRFVMAAVLMLGVTVYFALEVGKLYDLEAAGVITPIHLRLARVTTFAYIAPLISGPLAYRGLINVGIHRLGAWLVLILTLASTVTGVMMLMGAEKLPIPS